MLWRDGIQRPVEMVVALLVGEGAEDGQQLMDDRVGRYEGDERPEPTKCLDDVLSICLDEGAHGWFELVDASPSYLADGDHPTMKVQLGKDAREQAMSPS